MHHNEDENFYLFETTTAKLCQHMTHVEQSGDTILGNPVFRGGRDWWIVCRKGQVAA